MFARCHLGVAGGVDARLLLPFLKERLEAVCHYDDKDELTRFSFLMDGTEEVRVSLLVVADVAKRVVSPAKPARVVLLSWVLVGGGPL